jgi:hypothetical protein
MPSGISAGALAVTRALQQGAGGVKQLDAFVIDLIGGMSI